MSRCITLMLVVAALCAAGTVNAIAPSGPKTMPTPCYAKYYNGFCYLESKKEVCTFYSSPTYATLKECLTSTNMGKTLMCGEATPAEQKNGDFKSCKDAADLPWVVQSGTDIPKQDIPCNSQAFCKVCGKDSVVKIACFKNSSCKAFTYSTKEGCGYLKSTGAKTATKAGAGWTTYVMP